MIEINRHTIKHQTEHENEREREKESICEEEREKGEIKKSSKYIKHRYIIKHLMEIDRYIIKNWTEHENPQN